ncbi:hypothetical protein [Taibaiella koreensis]|uniref:hypothetical protein n=1 Tax=Taibaiella koreensis TaxID=1268548 RepID=UPI000E59C672|nr:hypothetical protein [Taibaiella koreensis]
MRERLQPFFRFLPVQLFLLHFRKYQMILIFWCLLFAVISARAATHFGAVALFLSPEYLGKISVLSFSLLGGATAIFAMSWHITTFIIHSKRVPFLGATRHSFLKYCINNSIIPLSYLITYGILAARYLMIDEGAGTWTIIFMLCGFYLGYIFVLLLSFLYFFRADRNILKVVLGTIANPSVIRELIPYDTLDTEFELVKADSYLTHIFKIEKIKTPYEYNTRFLNTVLRRHHRNAIFAIFFAAVLLLILGIFMDEPVLRIPAAAGFLILFSILLAAVGAFKYFLRSWEIIGWLFIFSLTGFMARHRVFDLRSIAYGMKYDHATAPVYDYENLKQVFNDSVYRQDKRTEEARLDRWKQRVTRGAVPEGKPPLVIITASGGGSRASYWTFRCLQYADSLTGGKLFQHNVMICGASGGMIGAAYWRSVQTQYRLGKLRTPYGAYYQDLVGKDLLNAVIFSLACVDLVSPFNKITVAGRRYSKDRGYAFDKELAANSDGLLHYRLKDYQAYEAQALAPMLLINGTIINDGRRLLISPQPIGYLTRSESSLDKTNPIIDAIDYARFFARQDPLNLQIMSALRMSATFPIVLPVVKMPSMPEMDIMDAGLRDNFGMESSMRYLSTFRDWINENTSEIIFLQIRDTREYEPSLGDPENSMSGMLFDPMFAIQKKWGAFQTYHQSYLEDYVIEDFPPGKFKKITLQYIPANKDKTAALNFHLTAREKNDLILSVYNADNQEGFKTLTKLLK